MQMLLLIGTFAGAWAAIFGRIAQQEGIPTPVIIATRMLLGALILTPFVLPTYRAELSRLNRRDLFFTIIAGIWFAVHLLSGFESLKHTSVLVSSVLGGTLPIWVALLETYLLHTRLSRTIWIGLIITLLGGLIITLSGNASTLGNNPILGAILSIIAAVTGAVYAISGRRSRGKISFLPYLWMVFGIGGITALFVVILNGTTFTGYSSTGYTALILLTLLPQLVGHTVYNFALRRLPATFVSVVSQIGIVFSAVLALLIFHEIPVALQIPGSIAIVAGITLINLSKSHPG